MSNKELTPSQKLMLALGDYFDPSEVKWKPQAVKGNKAMAIAYVSARVIMDRLDEVVGPENWKDDYSILPDGDVVCTLSLRINGEWVPKKCVGSPSEQPDGGDRMKASFSDALKRVGIKWNLARYLYRLPMQWVDFDPQRKQFVTPPKLPPWAMPGQPQMSGLKLPPETDDAPPPEAAKPTPKSEPTKLLGEAVVTTDQANELKEWLTKTKANEADWAAILEFYKVAKGTRLSAVPASKHADILKGLKNKYARQMADADRANGPLAAPGAA